MQVTPEGFTTAKEGNSCCSTAAVSVYFLKYALTGSSQLGENRFSQPVKSKMAIAVKDVRSHLIFFKLFATFFIVIN